MNPYRNLLDNIIDFILKSDNIYYVAVVRDIVTPEITDKLDFEKFKEQEKQNFATIVVDDYLNYLYKKHGVKRNDNVINMLFN